MRPGLIKALRAIVVAPLFGAPAPSEEEKVELLKHSDETIGKMNTWLEGKSWIGGDSISLADLQVFNEFLSSYGAFEHDLTNHPNVAAWFQRCNENEWLAKCAQKAQEVRAALAASQQE